MKIENNLTIEESMALWEEHGIELPQKKKRVTQVKLGKTLERPKTLRSMADIQNWLGDCQRCGLCQERNKIVFGSGNPKSKLLFVGEGPGANEDKTGLPFVGRAGDLLTKIIEAMSLTRDEIYIANIVKCRPPSNRVPLPDEIDNCLPFLKAQIDLIQPQMIVALGLTAASTLTGIDTPMGSLRGQFHPLAWENKITVLPTYHPAYLLRNPAAKKIVWEDMKLVMKRLKAKSL